MATSATPKKPSTRKPAARSAAAGTFSPAERAAIRARAKEAAGSGADDVLAKIAEMADGDRHLAERVHAIVTAAAPDLTLRTYYGMPAYAKDGKVLCWFKSAAKFKTRYATVGFSDVAALDSGALWPTEYAITEIGPAVEKQLSALITKAVGPAPQ